MCMFLIHQEVNMTSGKFYIIYHLTRFWILCYSLLVPEGEDRAMKQIYKNYKDENFANILNFAKLTKFPKICDNCGEVFEANLITHFHFQDRMFNIKCPVCFSMYYVVYNELNDFYYLEFAKAADDFPLCSNF